MRQSVRLGRVAGIDIGANWSALVIAALLGYLLAAVVLPTGAPGRSGLAYAIVAVVVAALFLAGLLGHELAHALVARRHGVTVRRITLWLLGGVSELESEPSSPRAEFQIAIAGPAASLAVAAVAAVGAVLAAAAGASNLIMVGLSWLAAVNVLLAVFNLLPGAPLDGGRIVRAVVWRLRGDRDRAQVIAGRAGVVVGILLGVLGLVQVFALGTFSGLWLVLLGWFLVSAANAETAGVRLQRALEGRSVRDIMTADPVYGLDNQTVDAFVADTAARHPHAMYPVVDVDRRLVGVVRLADLARVPESGRAQVPLRAVATPTPEVPDIAATEPASTAARTLSPSTPLLPVTENHRLVGVVSAGDIANAMALATLGQATPPPGAAGDGGRPGGDGGGPSGETGPSEREGRSQPGS
ncbi:MAG: site-2 protease family protein [Micromonosporaceae bacterium]|nr:site-2 protease family protein [Micromonosporaceae bacterium]